MFPYKCFYRNANFTLVYKGKTSSYVSVASRWRCGKTVMQFLTQGLARRTMVWSVCLSAFGREYTLLLIFLVLKLPLILSISWFYICAIMLFSTKHFPCYLPPTKFLITFLDCLMTPLFYCCGLSLSPIDSMAHKA